MQEFDLLGHVVSKDGIRPNSRKLSVFKQMLPPTNVKSLQRFLGVLNWFRKFMPNVSELTHPLNKLLHKGTPWSWSTECQTAFEKLKDSLSEDTLIALPQFGKPYIIVVDA